jgi:hypothetical protein
VPYLDLIDRLQPLTKEIGADRASGERVLELCRQLEERPRVGAVVTSDALDGELKRELGRLVELLSRRSAKAVPLAKLGRAALADLAGDERMLRIVLIECDSQLAVLGY